MTAAAPGHGSSRQRHDAGISAIGKPVDAPDGQAVLAGAGLTRIAVPIDRTT